MKKLIFIVLMLFFSLMNAQIISFSDPNFKARLLVSSVSNGIVKDVNGNPLRIDANFNNQIEESEAASVYKLDLMGGGSNLTDINEISYFFNLTDLNCSYNPITSLDVTNLNALKFLNCESTHITDLNVMNLSNLELLNIAGNYLTTLNLTGLTNLVNLDCSLSLSLPLLVLSDLPNLRTIEIIRCDVLLSLTVSNMPHLEFLNCGGGVLTSLNLSNLPNLNKLYCNQNHLTALSVGAFSNLSDFVCSQNQISSLDTGGLTNLTKVNVYSNLLTSLDVNNSPNLISVQCNNNLLTSLVLTDKLNLQWIECANNDIATLGVSNLPAMFQLGCNYNEITVIPNLNTFTNLTVLSCAINHITTLDVSSLTELNTFYADSNNLFSLFMKNGKQATSFGAANNPNLSYICADEIEIPYIPQFPNCTINSYCSFTPGGTYYNINGNQHFDVDGNGCDVSDASLPNMKFRIDSGAVQVTLISDSSGNISMPFQSGTYVINPILEHPEYFSVSPQNATISFPQDVNPSINEFCVTPNGVHNDLEISLLPISSARPGFDSDYKIIYKNKGNTVQSGTIKFDFQNDRIDLISSVPPISTQQGNYLWWDYTSLLPFERREISIRLNLNSPVEIPANNGGDWLGFGAGISPFEYDEHAVDNHGELKQLVVNSYDPNDKICAEGNIIGPEMIGKDIHYVIHFENNGTANAENIVVKDIIDVAKFDINSLIPLDGSHPFVTKISNTNKVEFIFENINLPFDNDNNDGYVAFKIKTKPTLILGDTFTNNASIYFDYNAAILTNDATTAIQLLDSQDFEFADYFKIYPNPASATLNIDSKKQIGITSISVYNILGQLVIAIPNAQQVSSIDISSLNVGNYFIKINSDKGTTNAKFAKN